MKLSTVRARPRCRTNRPSYPRALTAGVVLAAATACGSSVEVLEGSGGQPPSTTSTVTGWAGSPAGGMQQPWGGFGGGQPTGAGGLPFGGYGGAPSGGGTGGTGNWGGGLSGDMPPPWGGGDSF